MPGPGEQRPKLTYLNTRTKAFALRVLLNVGNVDFEDCRVEMNDWAKLKNDTPMGQLPVLEYNKGKLCQSIAIAEFISEKAGLTPKDDWMKAKVMEVICCCEDVGQMFVASNQEKNLTTKKELRDKLCKETVTE